MPDLIRHPCALGDGPRIEPGVTRGRDDRGNVQEPVMPDLIRHPCALGDGPRVKPGVTKGGVKPRVSADGCATA
jgi:hypothetical protein